MTTKELIEAEIDKMSEEDLERLYDLIRDFVQAAPQTKQRYPQELRREHCPHAGRGSGGDQDQPRQRDGRHLGTDRRDQVGGEQSAQPTRNRAVTRHVRPA